jgi:hypothetical protein
LIVGVSGLLAGEDFDRGVDRGDDVGKEEVRVGGSRNFVVEGEDVRGRSFVVESRRSLMVGVWGLVPVSGLLAGGDFDCGVDRDVDMGKGVRGESSGGNGSFGSDDVRSNGGGFIDKIIEDVRRDVGSQ